MFCTQCGNTIKDDAAFCTNCGAPQKRKPAEENEKIVTEAPKNSFGFSKAGNLNGTANPEPREVPAPKTAPVATKAPSTEAVSVPAHSAPAPKVVVSADPVATDWNYSYFDGSLLGLIGVNLVVGLVSLITFGLAWPALTCYRLRWVYKHTCIGGYRLRFTGKGIQLFGKYCLWVFLSIITFTIYAWWVPIKYKKWETSHVVIDSMVPRKY